MAAFLTGWTSFVAGFAGAIAAGALGISDYLGRFVPVASDATPLFTVPLPWLPLVFSPRTVVALTAIVGLALIHIRGLGPGRLVQNALAVLKIGALSLFVAIGLGFGRGSFANLTTAPEVASLNLPLAFIVVMFAYSGWNAASYVAEEIREPGRNVPIALALGTGAIVLLYLGLNVLYLYAVPIAEIGAGEQSELAMVAADRLLGPTAARAARRARGGRAVRKPQRHDGRRARASTSRWRATAPSSRPRPASTRVSTRRGCRSPRRPRGARSWSSTNTKDQLAEYTGFAVLMFSAFAVSSLFILRRRYPDEPRPFKAWGYPVAPAAFVVVSFTIMVAAIAGRPGPSLYGALIIAAGIPLYLVFRKKSVGN